MKYGIPVMVRDAVIVGDVIWFCTEEFTCLFSKNIDSGDVTCYPVLVEIPRYCPYDKITYVDNKLILTPLCVNRIAIFDIEKKKFSFISISEKYRGSHFYEGVKWENYLFMFSCTFPVVLRMNLLTYDIDYIVGWESAINNKKGKNSNELLARQAIIVEDRLLIPLRHDGYILSVDVKSLQYKLHFIGEGVTGFEGIAYDGEFVLCTSSERGKPTYVLDKECRIKTVLQSEYVEDGRNFEACAIGCVGTKRYVFCTSEVYFNDETIKRVYGENSIIHIHDKYISYYNKKTKMLELYGEDDIREYELKIDMQNLLSIKCDFVETEGITLKEFLYMVEHNDKEN